MTAPQPLENRATSDAQLHSGVVSANQPSKPELLTPSIAADYELLAKLFQGATISESFAAIASAVANELPVDRVSLLKRQTSRCTLIATSTQPKVDRRARQVRLLERLVSHVLAIRSPLTFELGGTTARFANEIPQLESYLEESGCREIHIEAIQNDELSESVAFIVVERFRILDNFKTPIADVLGPLRILIRSAVANAIRREDGIWRTFSERVSRGSARRQLVGCCIAVGLLLAGAIVPVQLKLPVEGRIVAAKQRHLFAPAEGIVSDVLVTNGETVASGQPLVVIRSPQFELLQQRVASDLATAETRLESLLALRSRDRESNLSVDEQALRTEIQGLASQLALLQNQQTALTVHSPIDGQVDGWDLYQSLASRPVAHGQFLLNIVAADNGWTVELDIPDQQMGYVLKAQHEAACRCSLRLRSHPTQTYDGELEQIDEVAHLGPLGESFVRATVRLKSTDAERFRSGATVIAQVHCGEYSFGFVWLRGIAEWWRGQNW